MLRSKSEIINAASRGQPTDWLSLNCRCGNCRRTLGCRDDCSSEDHAPLFLFNPATLEISLECLWFGCPEGEAGREGVGGACGEERG